MNLKTKVLVFVYGSLLEGLHNHGHLSRVNARKICDDSIRAKLFTCNWSWPHIIFSHSNKDRVKGEVYEVTYQTVITSLDRLEGYSIHHHSLHGKTCGCLFLRKKALTKSGLKVIVYEGGNELHRASYLTQIPDGDWKTAYQKHHATRFTSSTEGEEDGNEES